MGDIYFAQTKYLTTVRCRYDEAMLKCNDEAMMKQNFDDESDGKGQRNQSRLKAYWVDDNIKILENT